MSSELSANFTKANLDTYLKEVAKEYRKQVGKAMQAEIVLIGGAAILARYGFRDATADVDAVILAASSIKDAINHVGDRYGLPAGWLNDEFLHTDSYTPRLLQYAAYYKTFSNVLVVRTITAEYLIAMKLRSGRRYKNDLSDVLGIMAEHEKSGHPITKEQIDKAVLDLYGGWDAIPENSRAFMNEMLANGNYAKAYAEVAEQERQNQDILLRFEQTYPDALQAQNVDKVLQELTAKKESRDDIIALLQAKKAEQESGKQGG